MDGSPLLLSPTTLIAFSLSPSPSSHYQTIDDRLALFIALFSYVFIAFIGGLVPALFWLWFWLREDKAKPEPFLLITVAFISGMAVVPLALPLQKLAIELYGGDNLILVWVIIEEVLKYSIAL
jgi:hypothetical protein